MPTGADYYTGNLSADNPAVLSGGYEETLSDEYSTTVKVHWNLTRSDD